VIEYKTGNILDDDAEALVNPVNCVGIMGRGLALQFKKAFPRNFASYAAACKRNEVQPGRMLVFEAGELTNPRYIINLPTKNKADTKRALSKSPISSKVCTVFPNRGGQHRCRASQ
jgi:O-acetyl-ADP-ribose deacetylase (regulator of RNase III)